MVAVGDVGDDIFESLSEPDGVGEEGTHQPPCHDDVGFELCDELSGLSDDLQVAFFLLSSAEDFHLCRCLIDFVVFYEIVGDDELDVTDATSVEALYQL